MFLANVVAIFASYLGPRFCVAQSLPENGVTIYARIDLQREKLSRALNSALQTLEESGAVSAAARQRLSDIRRSLVARDPSRQYVFYRTGDTASSLASRWKLTADQIATIQAARVEFAEGIFRLARRQLDQHQPTLTYQLLNETVFFDPNHEKAKRILKLLERQANAGSQIKVQVARTRHAKLPWPAGRYVRIQSPHYSVATNDEQSSGVALAKTLENLHAVWRAVFFEYWSSEAALRKAWNGRPRRSKSRRKYRVVLFQNRQQYAAALQKIQPRIGITKGYYDPKGRTAYFFTGEDSDTATWLHESTHQLFHETRSRDYQVGEQSNFWLVEGIALYMESLHQLQPGFATLGGLDAERLQYARFRRLREDFYVPLRELSALGRSSLQQHEHIRRLYSQAAGLTHFLMHHQQGNHRDALHALLQDIYTNRHRTRTLLPSTKLSFEELDHQYHQFLNVTDSDLADWQPRRPLKSLALGGTSITDAGLRHLPRLGDLQWFDVGATAATDQGLEALKSAVNLRQLSLDQTRITDATLSVIAGAPLEELDLTATAVTDSGLARLAALRTLKSLAVDHTQVTAAGMKELRRALPQLRDTSQ